MNRSPGSTRAACSQIYLIISSHLPSKLFIYFLRAFIYKPFNISLLLSVRFHTYLLCIFITTSQHPLPSSRLSPNLLSRRSTTYSLGSPPPFHQPQTSLPLSTIGSFTCSLICSILSSPSHSTLFPSQIHPRNHTYSHSHTLTHTHIHTNE